MKDIQEVIRQKEVQIQLLLKEIEALKTAAALLTDPAVRVQPGNAGATVPRGAVASESGSRNGAASPKRWP